MKNSIEQIISFEDKLVEIPDETYRNLYEFFSSTTKHINANWEEEKIFRTISNLLHSQDIKIVKQSYNLLSSCLASKEFDCRIALLYFSVGEILNIPIKVVSGPRHLFVRLNKTNWETTSSEILSNKHYADWLDIHEEPINNGVYLKDFTKDKTIAIGLSHIGSDLSSRGELEEAIKYFKKAIILRPKDVESHNNICIAEAKLGDLDSALNNINIAINLDPYFAPSFLNKGNVLQKRGNFELAIENCDRAIKLNPKYAKAYFVRGLNYAQIGDRIKAEKDFIKAGMIDESILELLENV